MTKLPFSVLAVLFIGIGLSSCVTTNAEGIKQSEFHGLAVSGERTRIGRDWSLNPDCSMLALPKVRVLEAPKHGKLEINSEAIFPTASGFYKKCNATRVRGTVEYYTSDKGFVGKDRIVTRSSYGDGLVQDATTNINVVK
ncbi:hypothetical protein [Rhizobium rhizogenes]|uniref:hypothetical protein n=1 Tax=Rhizobium rhizogenes TaxID=359 RepID=UPI00068A9E2F|nr:hypothetical protein [Rhizobium rhizogenes]NTG84521.1 hypothetical protein [Rhizobium rhizogenes]NTH75511.1 hypothetical protein [Rhizobium rhizogenes]NTH81516.1 hypothetical protein [Rhizobium rhizogenes]NTI39741.1 hypothetical protein [Rhizobium rhizogenes]WEO64740.1 hypothetical protein G6L54_017065 [Rhizobium rhizogenes]